MKTVTRDRYGSPEVLRVVEVDRPEPDAGQVLIRVYSTTVNRTDCATLWGKPFVYRFFVGFPRPRCPATGTDFAGEIVAVGQGVTRFRAGDRVWGFDDHGAGSHAEYMTIGEHQPIAKMPNGISYEDAASSLEGAHYAINFLNKVSLRPGQHVLVNGATGAIGSAAVQLLKLQDIRVTAVCGAENVDRVAALGADRVMDYVKEDFTQENAQYDFVFDSVGKRTFGECKRVLTPRGIYISSELGPLWQNLPLAVVTPMLGGRKVVFPVPINVQATLSLMGRLLEEGKFKPLIDRSYPIEKIREAFDYVASGQKIGNVLLQPGLPSVTSQ